MWSLQAVVVAALCHAMLARSLPHHTTTRAEVHAHAHGHHDILVSNKTTMMELLSMVDFVDTLKSSNLDDDDRDLEQELTSYEVLFHDSLFEFITGQPQAALRKMHSAEIPETNQVFRETGMTRDMLKKAPLSCLPPMRTFAEGIEIFYMYSRNGNVVKPNDLQSAYKSSFGIDLSRQMAEAMVRGMQYNPRKEDAAPTVSKCEFVKGYMEQRGAMNYRLVADVDPAFSLKPWWNTQRVLSTTRAHVSEPWIRYLDSLYALDRPAGEHMTKCEVALMLGACRTYVGRHFLAHTIPNAKGKDSHAWETFDQSRLFPLTKDQAAAKFQQASKMLVNLFAVHDTSGNGVLDRQEFSRLLKTMDLWQDAAVFQEVDNANKKLEEQQAGGETNQQQSTMVTELDIKQLKFSSILSSSKTARVERVWNAIRDPKTQQVSKPRIERMLRATGRVAEGELEEASQTLIDSFSSQGRSAKASTLSKQEFQLASLVPPSLTTAFRTHTLEVVLGYLAGYTFENEGTAKRHEEHNLPVTRTLDKEMFLLFVPIVRAFLDLGGGTHEDGRLTFEEFKQIKSVLPRLKRSNMLRTNEKMSDTYASFISRDRETMSLADFTKIFTVADSEIKENSDGMPFITLKSFIWVPRLKLPKDERGLLEADLLDQANFRAHLAKKLDGDKPK